MLILGSSSPRRKEILEFFSIPFKQVSPDCDETQVLFNGDPAHYAREVARRKALCLASLQDSVVLTADTVVFSGSKVFLKPESLQEAHSMLQELAGKQHSVFTGVCVAHGHDIWIDSEETKVTFHPLTSEQIHLYHKAVSPLDKAGGYAIQKGGSLIVKRIEGCYYNIMGLPVQTVGRLLSKAGIDLWHYLKPF